MLKIIRRVFSFNDFSRSHPSEQQPGDWLDAQFDEIIDKIDAWDARVKLAIKDDGTIAAGAVGEFAIQPAVFAAVLKTLRDELLVPTGAALAAQKTAETALLLAKQTLQEAEQTLAAIKSASNDILVAQNAATVKTDQSTAIAAEIIAKSAQLAAESAEIRSDWDDASSEAQAWALSSALWAEHMPDTLPDNAVKIMDISGDHWSSRWWANRADNAFGRLTDLYLGAWPDPPTSNLEGGPIQIGSIYYDTDSGQPYVWDGANWVPFWTPAAATTASLWYRASAGQTTFPLSVPDQNGNTFAYDQTHPEGTEIHVNGIRLTPNYGSSAEADFSVNTVTSTLTLLRPLRVGDILGVDLLVAPVKLASGAATVWALKLNEAVDGIRLTFSLAPKSVSGPIVSISRAETLLVSLDGAIQEPGYAYTAIDNQISFTTAPTADQRLFLNWYQSAPASAAAAVTYGYTFDVGVSEPPGNQQMRDNAVDPAAVTLIWLRSLDADGADVSNVLRNINAAHRLYVQEKADSTHWQRYDVTGPAIEKTGYFELPVAWTSGSGNTLTDNRIVGVVFTEKPPLAAPLPAEIP